MTIIGTFLVLITAFCLKPLLITNQSLQLPTASAYDRYSNVSAFEESDDDAPNVFLTQRHPQLFVNTEDRNYDMTRQFDTRGGKRNSKSQVKDENEGHKRQFSPWGGKRTSKTSLISNDELTHADSKLTDLYLTRDKKSFNSWGGKRSFNSWGGKRSFNSWGGKRNFNAWGVKRIKNDPKKRIDVLFFVPKKYIVAGSKRQAFNSRGGKRAFNSWVGKRVFSSWGRKRAIELEPKDVNISEDNLIPKAYKDILEGTETNMR